MFNPLALIGRLLGAKTLRAQVSPPGRDGQLKDTVQGSLRVGQHLNPERAARRRRIKAFGGFRQYKRQMRALKALRTELRAAEVAQ